MISAMPSSFGLVVLAVVVHLGPVDEHHQVGVLLDGAGVAQVGEDRLPVAAPLLRGARQLRQRDDRHLELPASALSEREMSEISCTRFSAYSGLRISCR